MMQQITLGGAMIALPLFLQMTLEYNAMEAGPVARAAVAQHVRRRAARRQEGGEAAARPTSSWSASRSARSGSQLIIPIVPRADSGWALVVPLLIAGSGLGLLVSQLNNYTLSPIEEERVSEAAGVNSAAGSFGLSFGLAMAGGIMLAVLSFELHEPGSNDSAVIPAAQQQQIATRSRTTPR